MTIDRICAFPNNHQEKLKQKPNGVTHLEKSFFNRVQGTRAAL
jgi:hypothetical protein